MLLKTISNLWHSSCKSHRLKILGKGAHSVFQIQLLYSMNRGSEGARQNAQISFIFEISRCAAAKRLKSFEPDGIIASVLFASEPSESSSFASKCWDLANCITARPSSSLCSLFFYRSVLASKSYKCRKVWGFEESSKNIQGQSVTHITSIPKVSQTLRFWS